jgi:hypothetical protein
MILREEQVQARIVHYKAEMETNSELDAITAGVVAQLQQLQQKVAAERAPESKAHIEAEQTRAFVSLLGRIFRADGISVLVQNEMKDVTRRISRMFFESELHEKMTEGQPKTRTMHHAEQALFYVLKRHHNRLHAELEGFEYADAEIKELTMDLLDKTMNDFRVSFLSRRSPELKRLLAVFTEVLAEYFQKGLPPEIPDLARAVITDAGTATATNAVGYKVLHESFPKFRQAMERRFVGSLVRYSQQRIVKKLEASQDAFRDETIAFVQSPQIYSDVCAVICDAMYEFLCNEGFLDLPIDWRSENAASTS